MRIAIHNTPGSFSDRWIQYCVSQKIDYKIVDAFSTTIIHDLKDCDAFMWHWHPSYRDALFAQQLIRSLEVFGVKTFPNSNTCWHFDDKVGQKYLLEALNVPFVTTNVFYSKQDALHWLENVEYPLVFKLRGGATSINVRLVKNKSAARGLVRKAFGNGFQVHNKRFILAECIRQFRKNKTIRNAKRIGYWSVLNVINSKFDELFQRQKGYVYFQKFVPNNNHDIRIIVIENRAFGIKRMVRENDFRASGSGNFSYRKEDLSIECVKLAFQVSKALKSQSLALDFIFDNNTPLVVELSYGFAVEVYDLCPGYWDENLQWHEGKFNPQSWMVENLIKTIQ